MVLVTATAMLLVAALAGADEMRMEVVQPTIVLHCDCGECWLPRVDRRWV